MEQKNNLKVIHYNIYYIIQGPSNPKYKTILCKHYGTPQGCGYGDKCQFAHGFAELRTTGNQFMNPQMSAFNDKAQNNAINYKIAKCKNWEKDQTCRYGNKCSFAHGDEELRKKEDNMKNFNPGIPMFMMMDPNGQPMMVPAAQGLDINQMNMNMNMPMMPPNFDPNQFMMGMMPTNFPQGGNIEKENNTGGSNDKNQQ